MTPASALRIGMCVRLDGVTYKVLLAETRVGTAKLPSSVHLRLRNLRTGTQTEQRLHPDARVETVAVETIAMTYTYTDGDTLYFMHPVTFDQVAVPRRLVGPFEKFLTSETRLKIELLGEEPVDVLVPATVDVVVASTGPALHGDVDAAPKSATLENGLEIHVPQFIKAGERIRIEVATGTYRERVK